MDDKRIYNVNVIAQDVLLTPDAIKERVPMTTRAQATVLDGRQAVEDILDRTDHRLMIVVGPCSIHDPSAAMDYAQRLKRLADELADTLCIVMRVYFEKPRTTTGWKGLINDPHMNDSFDIEEGLQLARKVLLDINELGLPAGTEARFREVIEAMSATSQRAFRSIVHEDPQLFQLFLAATPVRELTHVHFGSRPTYRERGVGTIQGIRAIPWNFGWTQMRLMVAAWLVTTGLLRSFSSLSMMPAVGRPVPLIRSTWALVASALRASS